MLSDQRSILHGNVSDVYDVLGDMYDVLDDMYDVLGDMYELPKFICSVTWCVIMPTGLLCDYKKECAVVWSECYYG